MQQSGRIDSQIGKNLRFESSVNSEGIETEDEEITPEQAV